MFPLKLVRVMYIWVEEFLDGWLTAPRRGWHCRRTTSLPLVLAAWISYRLGDDGSRRVEECPVRRPRFDATVELVGLGLSSRGGTKMSDGPCRPLGDDESCHHHEQEVSPTVMNLEKRRSSVGERRSCPLDAVHCAYALRALRWLPRPCLIVWVCYDLIPLMKGG